MANAAHNSPQMAERYLLGELLGDERERFEEHYFSCPECAQDVLAGAEFIDNARAELPRIHEKTERARSFGWLWGPQWACAAAALLLLTVYQAIGLSRLATAPAAELAISSGAIITASRGPAGPHLSGRGAPKDLVIPNEWDGSFERYQGELERDGKVVKTTTYSLPKGAPSPNVLVISVPVSSLAKGKYILALYGQPASGPRQPLERVPIPVGDER